MDRRRARPSHCVCSDIVELEGWVHSRAKTRCARRRECKYLFFFLCFFFLVFGSQYRVPSSPRYSQKHKRMHPCLLPRPARTGAPLIRPIIRILRRRALHRSLELLCTGRCDESVAMENARPGSSRKRPTTGHGGRGRCSVTVVVLPVEQSNRQKKEAARIQENGPRAWKK